MPTQLFSSLLITNTYITTFHVSLVLLNPLGHKILLSCIVVLPHMGFFKNVTSVNGESLLYRTEHQPTAILSSLT